MKSKQKPFIEILVKKFPEYSEKELYSMIVCGEVKVDGETVRDPRRKIDPSKEIISGAKKWVSRGGEKLDYAIKIWKIRVEGKTVLDAGASTGGFTDCLLQRGAAFIHAVDVGYNQLDYGLRMNPRVNVLERTNIMSITGLEPAPDLAVADLSFRSITGAASSILKLTSENLLIALIKPQFELSETEGFDGVIRDEAVLHNVLRTTADAVGREGVKLHALLKSPIKGGKGNTEYLFRLSIFDGDSSLNNLEIIEKYLDETSGFS